MVSGYYLISKEKFNHLELWEKALVIFTDSELMLLTGLNNDGISNIKRKKQTPSKLTKDLLASAFFFLDPNLLEDRLKELDTGDKYRMSIDIRKAIKKDLLLHLLEVTI